jgi:hypothetical protein
MLARGFGPSTWLSDGNRCAVVRGCRDPADDEATTLAWEIVQMLTTIAVVLLILWLLGIVSSYTIGGLIHLLLVVAIVMFLVRIIQGRRPIV